MKPLRVLIVEDSKDDAELLLRDLKRSGYDVVHARVDTREELHTALTKNTWDMVISDYAMPHFNALDALSVLKDTGLDLPFLVVSGTIGEETAVETMKAGAHDYLMKGNLQRLLPAVERELREAKVRAERAQAEVALYESEEKFRFMFEHNPVPMWVADGETLAFLEVNEAAVSCYGYSRGEFLNMAMSDLRLRPGLPSILKQAGVKLGISSGHRRVGEEKHKLKNGNVIDAEIHSDTLEYGGKTLVLIIAQDVTHRVQAEKELIRAHEMALEASQLKSEFLANVSHEIRTPLNGIIGATEFLVNANLPEKENEWIDIIRMAGDSLLNTVNQVLDFSKMESGQVELDVVYFNLPQLIDETTKTFLSTVKKKNIKLDVQIPSSVPANLKGDAARLQQVLKNIIDNAIKFTDQGKVTLSVQNESENNENAVLRFSIRDTGMGIAPQAHKRMFQPFSQADYSLTRKYGGTGLGLAICKKIVTRMGGDIGFDSEAGKGSNFWFTLSFKKTHQTKG